CSSSSYLPVFEHLFLLRTRPFFVRTEAFECDFTASFLYFQYVSPQLLHSLHQSFSRALQSAPGRRPRSVLPAAVSQISLPPRTAPPGLFRRCPPEASEAPAPGSGIPPDWKPESTAPVLPPRRARSGRRPAWPPYRLRRPPGRSLLSWPPHSAAACSSHKYKDTPLLPRNPAAPPAAGKLEHGHSPCI